MWVGEQYTGLSINAQLFRVNLLFYLCGVLHLDDVALLDAKISHQIVLRLASLFSGAQSSLSKTFLEHSVNGLMVGGLWRIE